MTVISYGATDVGRRRKSNEDSYFIDDQLGFYVVADGMGGHAAGEVASSEAIDAITSLIFNERMLIEDFRAGKIDTDVGLRKIGRCIESSIQSAAYLVHGMAQIDQQKTGMGTTISALLVVGNFGLTGQVGDSRVYYIRSNQAVQLTEDHTLINWQLKEGLITQEQAAVAKHRNVVTRAVGSKDYVQVDVQSFPVHPGDQFMLCSDGLYEYLTPPEIAAILQHEPEEATRHFIEVALSRGGKDNVTSIVVKIV